MTWRISNCVIKEEVVDIFMLAVSIEVYKVWTVNGFERGVRRTMNISIFASIGSFDYVDELHIN